MWSYGLSHLAQNHGMLIQFFFLKGNENRFIVITGKKQVSRIGKKQNVYLQIWCDIHQASLGPITKPNTSLGQKSFKTTTKKNIKGGFSATMAFAEPTHPLFWFLKHNDAHGAPRT
jgi:hypothetical protein